MKICDHFKTILIIGTVVVVEKVLVIPVLCYVAAAALYAGYAHKDVVVGFVKSKLGMK